MKMIVKKTPAMVEADVPKKCGACSGSGYYDDNGSPKCGWCHGTGLEPQPVAQDCYRCYGDGLIEDCDETGEETIEKCSVCAGKGWIMVMPN